VIQHAVKGEVTCCILFIDVWLARKVEELQVL
jgi:hypothetical protein